MPILAIIDKENKSVKTEEVIIKHTNKDKKIVKNIDLDNILEKAIANSYDLKLADFDVVIAKYGINEAKAEYLPKFGIYAGNEYNKNFKDSLTTITVGDVFVNPYTRFQTIAGATLTYNLYDFGVRKSYLDMAKEDVKLKNYLQLEQNQDLSLTVIDLYARILIVNEQIKLKKEILALEQKTLTMKNRLYKAGEASKIELNDQTAKVARVKKEIAVLEGLLEENLISMTFFTNEDYDIKNLKVADVQIPNININDEFDYSKSVTNHIHEHVLKKKQLELLAIKRTNYPKVNLYSKYYMYGSDPKKYAEGFNDFSPSNWAIGASVSMTPFDGGKVRSKVKQTEIEVKKVKVEKAKAIAELTKKIDTLKSNYKTNNSQLEASNSMVKELTTKEISMTKLLKNKIISPIDLQDSKVALLEEKIDNLKLKTTAVAIARSLQVLTKTY
ncbi:MAG: TolC family protein [bacterium]|nr:TolC family protein [bacterium]